jgi:hypothetical protein
LPWSTSGVVIFVVFCIVALIPTLEPRAFVRQMRKPIYLTPVALSILAVAGIYWSDAPWDAQTHKLSSRDRFNPRNLLARRSLLHDGHGSPMSGCWTVPVGDAITLTLQ